MVKDPGVRDYYMVANCPNTVTVKYAWDGPDNDLRVAECDPPPQLMRVKKKDTKV